MTAKAIGALLAGCAMVGLIGQASAQTMVEHSSEVRMQLDFVVPAPALAKFLPAGWEPNVATQGPAKDCNVRMIFIDRVDITKPDGSWREEVRQGNCVTIKEKSAAGEYKETRQCDPN